MGADMASSVMLAGLTTALRSGLQTALAGPRNRAAADALARLWAVDA